MTRWPRKTRWISIAVAAVGLPALAQDSRLDHFEAKIRPVLVTQCYACHSAGAPKVQGGLLLDSAKGVTRGGNSGALSDVLPRALRHTDSALKMPPGKPLPPEVIAEFETWVRNGLPVPESRAPVAAVPDGGKPVLWSLQKPVLDPLRKSIDAFVLAKLAEKNLTPSPEADRRTLIRRAYYDLTGLPPSTEEIASFVADRAPGAYERLVDRLLSSPRYGERWGRHWLDVARYADSANTSVNLGQRYAWSYTYRDWVIRALNDDLPYDRFLEYQLAADRIPNTDPRHLAALGFLSLGREFPKSYPETVDDRIDAVTRGMLGFTVACARCHDHKYDPIPTKDYYSFYGVFANLREPEEMPLLGSGTPVPEREAVYRRRLERIKAAEREYRERRHAEMVKFFKTQNAEYVTASRDAERLNNTEIEDLVRDRQLNLHVLSRWRAHVEQPADVPLSEFELIYTEGDSNNMRAIHDRYNIMRTLYAYDGAAARAMAVEDVPKPVAAHVFVRGNPNNPGAATPPHFLSALAGPEPPQFRDGAGRLDLAKAIADPANPLTARVIVNRVWMHHFGAGIVATPSDFGLRGDAPTHPELLDYLAVKFVESGWSLKKLHRMIMLSATYRQASADNEAARKLDPENRLLWKMNRRRLDIESLRDSMLHAAGVLDLTAGGLPFPLTAQPSVPRRSVYGFIERGRIPGLLNAFDFASPDQHAPMRFVTTVPQQALFFLNSPFVAEQAGLLAQRAGGGHNDATIDRLYRFTFGRAPTANELMAGGRFIESGGTDAAMPATANSAWRYGTGGEFTEFSAFVNNAWQGAAVLPAERSGKASLRATGGEPGELPEQAVVRRWVSSVSGAITIEGTLRHNQGVVPYGDGVRGRIVSSRDGELASWAVNGSSAETRLSGIKVQPGDTIDFIVDSRSDMEKDDFGWAPLVKQGATVWDSKSDFRGPPAKPLNVWARYAQVLLQTNEFAFVD